MTAHTCVNTASAGGVAPPCAACGEHVKAKYDAERAVIEAAKAYFRRRTLSAALLQKELDSAVGKLIALGDF